MPVTAMPEPVAPRAGMPTRAGLLTPTAISIHRYHSIAIQIATATIAAAHAAARATAA